MNDMKSVRRRTSDGRVLWFAWSPADFIAQTSHLTDEARSAYRELIEFAFLHGRGQTDFPDDDRTLQAAARVKPRRWPDIRFLLFECARPMFVKTTDGYWRNPWLVEEVRIAREKSGQASSAVRSRYKRSTDVEHPQHVRGTNKKEKKNEIQPAEPSVPPADVERQRAAGRAREAKAARIAKWCRDHDALICAGCAHARHMPSDCVKLSRDDRPCECDSTDATLKRELGGAFEAEFQMPWNAWTEQRELMETA